MRTLPRSNTRRTHHVSLYLVELLVHEHLHTGDGLRQGSVCRPRFSVLLEQRLRFLIAFLEELQGAAFHRSHVSNIGGHSLSHSVKPLPLSLALQPDVTKSSLRPPQLR